MHGASSDLRTIDQHGRSSWDPVAQARPVDALAAELVRWAAFLCPDGDIPESRRAELSAVLSEWAEHDSALLHRAWAYGSHRARSGELHRAVPALLWDAWQHAPTSDSTADLDVDVRPPETASIEAWTEGDVRNLRPHDDLDTVTSARLYEAIKTGISGHDRVVVDLSAVGFIDSSGLSALLVARRYAQRHDADLRLVRPSRACRRAIDITGLREVLGVDEDVADRMGVSA